MDNQDSKQTFSIPEKSNLGSNQPFDPSNLPRMMPSSGGGSFKKLIVIIVLAFIGIVIIIGGVLAYRSFSKVSFSSPGSLWDKFMGNSGSFKLINVPDTKKLIGTPQTFKINSPKITK